MHKPQHEQGVRVVRSDVEVHVLSLITKKHHCDKNRRNHQQLEIEGEPVQLVLRVEDEVSDTFADIRDDNLVVLLPKLVRGHVYEDFHNVEIK